MRGSGQTCSGRQCRHEAQARALLGGVRDESSDECGRCLLHALHPFCLHVRGQQEIVSFRAELMLNAESMPKPSSRGYFTTLLQETTMLQHSYEHLQPDKHHRINSKSEPCTGTPRRAA